MIVIYSNLHEFFKKNNEENRLRIERDMYAHCQEQLANSINQHVQRAGLAGLRGKARGGK